MTSVHDLEFFRDNGYLLLPNAFTAQEVDALAGRAAEASGSESPQRVMEKDGRLVRAVYGVHLLERTFDLLVRDRRVLEPARDLLGADVYVHQTQLNPKAPLIGDVWEWHQDFLYWARDDGMPRPDVLSVAVFLDDVTEFNGPIFIIPGSHKASLDDETATVADGWETAAQGVRHRIETDTIRGVVEEHGMVSVKAARGSVLIFHGCVLHCSPPNLSPLVRAILFIRYNAITNTLRTIPNPRPEWVASRRPSVVEPLDEPFLAAAVR